MSFDVAISTTFEEAFEAKRAGARWFAGGTDLIPEIKSGLAEPTRLVNLKQIDALRGIHVTDEGVTIGALTTLAEIANHELIRTKYRALAQACELAASPQIRNMATIGGNLNQDSRCAYYRNDFKCYLRGGDTCFMREGENREAAIIGYHDCVHVHPSDPANALEAFDAKIIVRGANGERTIASGEFFRAPDARDTRMNVLDENEIITSIQLPHVSDDSHSAYIKAMDRAVWAFALASAAVRIEMSNGTVSDARIVLGGVAPIPWRENRVEAALVEQFRAGGEWTEEILTQISETALTDAQPLTHNGYKRRLARAMVKRALMQSME